MGGIPIKPCELWRVKFVFGQMKGVFNPYTTQALCCTATVFNYLFMQSLARHGPHPQAFKSLKILGGI